MADVASVCLDECTLDVHILCFRPMANKSNIKTKAKIGANFKCVHPNTSNKDQRSLDLVLRGQEHQCQSIDGVRAIRGMRQIKSLG